MGQVARQVGPEKFGEISLYGITISIIGSIIMFGTDIITLPLISRRKGLAATRILQNVFQIRLYIYILLLIIFFIFLSICEVEKYYILLPLAGVFYLLNIAEININSLGDNKKIAISYCVAVLISSGLKIVALFFDLNYQTYIYIHTIELLLSGFFVFSISRLSAKFFIIPNINLKIIKIIIYRAMPIFVSSFLIMIYTRLDQVMISKLSTLHENGLYSTAFRFIDPFSFLIVALCLVFIPQISDVKKVSIRIHLLELVIITSIAISIFVIVFSSITIEYIYGVEYLESKKITLILLASMTLSFIGITLTRISAIDNKHKGIVWRVFYGALINIFLNYFLIPIYGAYGAAFSTVVAQFYASLIGFYTKDTKYLLVYLLNSIRFRYTREWLLKLCQN
ncbi:TPA: oligosaccharide flippase family protein [Vibrio vulnificus]|nr:oligosaccharide flippase family protein [Vibrio vulnificus]